VIENLNVRCWAGLLAATGEAAPTNTGAAGSRGRSLPRASRYIPERKTHCERHRYSRRSSTRTANLWDSSSGVALGKDGGGESNATKDVSILVACALAAAIITAS
jgi:hypothetical protein